MTDKTDLIREILEYVTAHGGENTATHLLVQAASAIQAQAAELEAVGAGGVQALSSAPAIGDELRDTLVAVSAAIAERDDRAAQKMICEILAASPTPPAEQQAAPKAAPTRTALPEGWTDCTIEFGNDGPEVVAYGPKRMMTRLAKWLGKYFAQVIAEAAPKAAPGEPSDYQILAITTAYEQGVGKGRQAYSSGKEIANPYGTGYRCDLAWQYGYEEGKEQAERIAEAAPQQEAQEPVAVPRFNCWSTNEGDSWFDHPADSQAIYDCLGNDAKVGDEYELTAGWTSVTARYRITEVVGDGEEYEVECISHPHENSAPQPAPDCHHRPPCDECAALAAQGVK